MGEKRETRDLIIIRAQPAAGGPAMIRRTTPEIIDILCSRRFLCPLSAFTLASPLETLPIPVLQTPCFDFRASVERKLAAVRDFHAIAIPLSRGNVRNARSNLSSRIITLSWWMSTVAIVCEIKHCGEITNTRYHVGFIGDV